MHMCFCVLLYFTACMLYYCNTVGWAWWDWRLIWWLTILLQCFDTVGWVTWPVKISSPNDLYCVEWDVKPYSTQLIATFQSEYYMSRPMRDHCIRSPNAKRPQAQFHYFQVVEKQSCMSKEWHHRICPRRQSGQETVMQMSPHFLD